MFRIKNVGFFLLCSLRWQLKEDRLSREREKEKGGGGIERGSNKGERGQASGCELSPRGKTVNVRFYTIEIEKKKKNKV